MIAEDPRDRYWDLPDPTIDLDPNDPVLEDPRAPYEPLGVLRMFRGGMSAEKIQGLLNLEPPELVGMLRCGIDLEQSAHYAGRPLHSDENFKGGQ
ncbi:hypothetical protein ACFXG4_23545 [Nocardia sp. NPDC059246]|uniref:hypothetical protein n=1 Tax=unclassified Nocardia TaxID=2637762 RepID=UPI003680B964